MGFIVANCIVLGVMGYLFMTDDTIATTDGNGGFSFFKATEDDSFAVKPGKRANLLAAYQNGKQKTFGATHAMSARLNTIGSRGNEFSEAAKSPFLAPGQLERLFKSHSSAKTWRVPVQRGRPTFGGALGTVEPSGEPGAAPFDTELAHPSRYRRYSVAKRQGGLSLATQNSIAIENAANGPEEHDVRVLKGRLVGVSGQGGKKSSVLLRFAHGAKAEASTTRIRLVDRDGASAHSFEIAWSSSDASYFYLLDSGVTQSSLARAKALWRHQAFAHGECAQSCQETFESRQMSAAAFLKRLTEVAKGGGFLTYVVQDYSLDETPRASAILLQDMTEQKWQVIRLKRHAG